jgi:hypothetical protein
VRLTVTPRDIKLSGHLGPICIACSNTRLFWIQASDAEQLVEIARLPEGPVRVTACGRCGSRHSVIMGRVD